jgi:hypothetical protein
VRAAIRDALGAPSAWLVAGAGFLARGGILVFALPVLSLPTPVGVTLLVPPLSVTTSGISSVFVPQLIAIGAAVVVVVVIALLLGALSDAVSYRLMADRSAAGRARSGMSGDPAGDARAARPGADPASERVPVRPGLLARLVATELFALLPAMAAGLVTVSRLISVGEQEFLLPTSVDVPYPVRVVQGAAEPVIALAACLLLADVANALISRRVLRRDERRRGPDSATSAASGASAGPDASLRPPAEHAGPAPIRRVRHDLVALARIGATWAGAWIVTLASIVPGVIAIGLAWPALRDAYTATMSRTPPSAEALVVATVAFVVAWVAAILVAGLGSAIRTILWSFATAP